jgi:hypothetical protein
MVCAFTYVLTVMVTHVLAKACDNEHPCAAAQYCFTVFACSNDADMSY